MPIAPLWIFVLVVLSGFVGVLLGRWWASTQQGVQLATLAAARDSAERLYREKEEELAGQQRELFTLSEELGKAKQRDQDQQERLRAQKDEIGAMQARMTEQFKIIANEILESKGKQLTEQHQESLQGLLMPLKERIKEFEQQVEKVYQEEGRERFALKREIAALVQQNHKLSTDADNLTKALKGDTRTQGAWGEMILEKLLERSGLVKGQEYTLQQSSTNEEGARLRPDVLVLLPNDKCVIIDSKVSLLNYERSTGATAEEDRAMHLRQHIESLRAHAKGLAAKDYTKLYPAGSVDFVLMFVPIEPAFLIALREKPEIFHEAFERGVVMVTHTTLMATLATIHSIWKHERIARNHMAIAERAGDLYDKFVGFADDMVRVGKQMDSAKASYAEAMGKLSEGKGNLVRQVEILKGLGAKTSKGLSPALLGRSLELHAEEPKE
jgi:DNA recombination protein RmuC